jgi:site-specific DNA-methyltransferase (adenine-specific)
MDQVLNTIQLGDCIELMNARHEGSVDLVFADPPFNIGYDYDVYEDSKEHRKYIDWSADWIRAVYRVLKPNGTFWLSIGDEYAAELKIESLKAGFHCRSWVIWYYTFGVNCSKKFTRSHTHLLYFVKDPNNFTFREEDLENRVPSARELVYNDKRANSKGRLPDDTWIIRPADAIGEMISDEDESWYPQLYSLPTDQDRTYILRPHDLENSFAPSENTWYFPRVAGTFKERAGFHGCQMPEQLLGRIIRTCSNPGDIVLDPFSGSATTLAVAKKLGRRFTGFEISKAYVKYGLQRLSNIRVGDRLDGSPEPMKSAPKTEASRVKKNRRKKSNSQIKIEENIKSRETKFSQIQLEMTYEGIIEAFRLTHEGFSSDRVVADPDINREFITTCEKLGLTGDARTWNILLFRLRKQGKLAHFETIHRTSIPWDECDKYIFASEIAWQMMIDDESAISLDEILCDPVLAAKFDKIAHRFAPGYKPLDYRWAALKLRKEAKYARSRAAILTPPARLGKMIPIEELNISRLIHRSGIYVLSDQERKLYAGEALELHARFTSHCRKAWLKETDSSVLVQTLPMNISTAGKLAWQSCLVEKFKPCFNSFELRSAS